MGKRDSKGDREEGLEENSVFNRVKAYMWTSVRLAFSCALWAKELAPVPRARLKKMGQPGSCLVLDPLGIQKPQLK